MKNMLTPLAKSVLIPLGLTVPASGTDVAISKNVFGSSMTTLTILNKEMDDIMKITKCLVIKMKQKNKRGFFLDVSRYINAILLGNMLGGKGAIATKAGK